MTKTEVKNYAISVYCSAIIIITDAEEGLRWLNRNQFVLLLRYSKKASALFKLDGHNDGKYTYLDYTTWDGSERWELIEGVPHMMASPTPEHQHILGELFFQFRGSLRNGSCTPYIAPLDVTFEQSDLTNTVVQPDLFVMCGEYGHDKRIIGVPDLVVEILSPSTAADDLVRKMNLYQRVGVQEYWVIEPDKKSSTCIYAMAIYYAGLQNINQVIW